ncbi:MAG: hypothetical protein M3077_12665 [Candidatus Dormibacteraeota bacterium]|nr:hypothetical protein [Candidatus Dormibacteraeota bacterium]
MTEQPWLDSHSKPTFGAISEDTVAIAILHSSGGKTIVARPLVDLGFDGYARRVGTMVTVPYQVKARRSLLKDGEFVYRIPVKALVRDPNAAIVFPYFPPPGPEPFEKAFVIPVEYFAKHCPILQSPRGAYFEFVAGFRGTKRKWSPFCFELHHLQDQWLDQLAGWSEEAMVRRPAGRIDAGSGPQHKLRGAFAEWFVAGQVQVAGGNKVIVAADRVRVDCVALVVHDLTTFSVGGLAVHSGLITPGRTFAISFGGTTFFADDRLWLVLLGAFANGTFHEDCFLIPSAAVPTLFSKATMANGRIGYRLGISLHRIPAKLEPYRVPTADLGRTILKNVRAAGKGQVWASRPGA